MFAWLALGILLAAALLVLLNWWANTDVKTAKTAMFFGIIALCGVFALLLIATGKGIAAIIPGAYAAWRMISSVRQQMPKGSQRSANEMHSSSDMTIKEAYEILGIKPGASEEEILAAYRQLMAKCHPDAGGNDWMASKLNEAKDILLK